MAAGHEALDPLVERHRVELAAALRRRVVERRVARCADVHVQLLPDRLEVVARLPECVRLAEEEAELLGAVRLRLQQVVERETELARELLHVDVAAVDQLAAVLVDLPFGELAAACPAAAPDPPRPLEHLRGETRLLQPVGARSPARPAPTTTTRVPGGGPVLAKAGRAKSAAPATAAPAPFRNPRRVVSAARLRSVPRPPRPRRPVVCAPTPSSSSRFLIIDSAGSAVAAQPPRARRARRRARRASGCARARRRRRGRCRRSRSTRRGTTPG